MAFLVNSQKKCEVTRNRILKARSLKLVPSNLRRSVTIQKNLPNACFYKEIVSILLACKFCFIDLLIADFKFEDDFSNSNSTVKLKWSIPKFKIWHDVKHFAVSPNLNPSMSTITVIKIKNYLN